jgi:uncharacterized membrane protein YhhN
MNKMQIFLIIFTLVSVAHITFIILKKRKLRRLSKIFIIPPLLAAYIAGAGSHLFFPIPALIFGWIGDVLLIRIDKKICFKLGLASFLLGHLCYIATFIQCLGFFGYGGGSLSITALVISIPLAIVFGIMSFRFIKPPREMVIPVIIYMVVLETVALLSLQVFVFNFGFAGALIFLGCLFFLTSDLILSYYTFRKLKPLAAVLIMAFYIIAQAGIILGLMSLYISL